MSLKIWVKVIMQAPISMLASDPSLPAGLDLVKLVMDKLWSDCITSHGRIRENQRLLRAHQHQQILKQMRVEETQSA